MNTKLNNKGFAITGILYTLFILFLLIMASILGGLQSKKNMLARSVLALEETYTGSEVTDRNLNNLTTAPVKGKYEFTIKNNNQKYTCYSYLNKGDDLSDITFTTKECNTYYGSRELIKIISFEKEG